MNTGRGLSKHRKSGRVPKSPKARHALKRLAESQEIKAKPSTCHHKTVSDALK